MNVLIARFAIILCAESPKKTAEELQTQETDFETIISPVLEWLTEYLILSRLEGNDAGEWGEYERILSIQSPH